MKCTPYYSSSMPNTSGIHFPQIFLVVQLSTSLFRPIGNPFPISAISICHPSSLSISTSFLLSTISPPYTTPLCHFSSFFHSCLLISILFILLHQRQCHAMGLLCHSSTWLVGRGRREERRRKKAIPERACPVSVEAKEL